MKFWRANLDEIQDIKPSVLDTVIFPAMADTPRSRGLFTGTPKGRANHLFELFYRCNNPKLSKDWASFNFPTWTNPFIDPEEIERARATVAPRLFQQEYEASFVNFEGQCFTEFDEEIHVIDDAALPTKWEGIWIGVDPGDINPAVVVVGLSAQKYYLLAVWQGGDGSNPVPSGVVYDWIEQQAEKYSGKMYRAFVDPSRPGVIFDLRQKRHKGLQRSVAAYNRIEEGVQLCNNLFFQDRLYVAKSCGRRFIDELISYHWKKDANDHVTNRIEEGQPDHAIDALRYVLASLHNRGGRLQTEGYLAAAA